MRPLVSVVVPTYNRAHLIGRSICSVLGQTYRDFDVIVVDDCSNDSTAEVVASFNDPRISYIRRDRNGGAAAARNAGIVASATEYVAFQDSDDEWLPDKLERQMKIFQNLSSDVGAVYCDHWVIGDGERRLCEAFHAMPEDGLVFNRALEAFLVRGPIFLQTAIIRRECFERVGMIDERMPTAEDWDIFLRVSKVYRLYHMPVPLVNRFVSPDSLTLAPESIPLGLERIYNKYREEISADRGTRSKYLCSLGSWNLSSGRIGEACRFLLPAFGVSPIDCSSTLLKLLAGEPLSASVTVGTALKAVARLPGILALPWRIALQRRLKRHAGS